ncbi:MAG: ISAs1 family transposase [Tatlockia sp.]|nr:ISAs1 family transposase [Tatlockia sp.]
MGANLIQSFQNIKDFRASQGRRYPLWLILLLVVMGTISGCRSYYALEDFGVRHYGVVSEKLGLTVTRLPSDTTFRRILQKLDFQTLAQQFEQWADSTFDTKPGEWVAIDGKSIRGTVMEPGTAYQNFVNMVSVYSSQLGVVLAAQQFESKYNSELKVVQTMLEALQLEGVVFTLDALHCQKNY